jgi:wobble nucleotide-excising tRNase
MATAPIIKSLNGLRNAGVFRDYTPSADLPNFQQFNLIYGFNGSGKTTLSRIFASLEAGVLRPELSQSCEFTIELTDSSEIRVDRQLNLLKGRLLVFNTDFVDANFRWKDGTANPIFYLGKQQTRLVQQLEAVQASLSRITAKAAESERLKVSSTRTFNGYKRDTARQIERSLGLQRGYDAGNLASDFTGKTYGATRKLTNARVAELTSIISQSQPPPKIQEIRRSSLSLRTLAKSTRKIIATTVGTMVNDRLRSHASMLPWVRQGLDYHQRHKLDSCLLCDNRLGAGRIAELEGIFDDSFIQLTTSINDARTILETTVSTIESIAMPSKAEFNKELQSKFTAALEKLTRTSVAIKKVITSNLTALNEKAASPTTKMGGDQLPSLNKMEELEIEYIRNLVEIEKLVASHNLSCEQFDQAREQTRETLKSHFLSENETRYRELENDLRSATKDAEKNRAEAEFLAEEITRLRSKIKEHGPAADRINLLLKSYLGHSELEIEAVDEGYQLKRNGQEILYQLSEGEKTATALCYFLSLLEADGRNIKNLIVIIDDPISSLDTRALNFAFNLIRGAIGDASQVIILTHNINFMNEVKKWLKRKTPHSATLLFLKAKQSSIDAGRNSILVELPKLIRDYDSEYQFLFSIVLQYSSSADPFSENFYLIPNALRKLLDVFLAFKVPGPNGLADKLNNPIIRECGIAPQRLCALDRLVQVESHADNLDDLISLSSMTVEETKDAAVTLLEMIDHVDRSHFQQLCSLCR